MNEGTNPQINEHDLRRRMTDAESRMQLCTHSVRRMDSLSRLAARVALLSDQEFEMTFKTIESLVDTALQKKKSELAKAADSRVKIK